MDKERIIQLHHKPEDLLEFVRHLKEAVAEDDPNRKEIIDAFEDIVGLLGIVIDSMTSISMEKEKPVRRPSSGRTKKPVS